LRWLERDFLSSIGKRPISEITTSELIPVIEKIEERGADTARRQRGRCEHIFRYAIQTGRAKYNPAIDTQGIIKSQKTGHRPAMSQKELGPFLRELDSFDRIKPVTKLGLNLLILTFVRPGEMRGALWEEFNIDGKEWRIPAERMKMGTEHIVPLSPQALAILEELKLLTGRSDYLFPSDRSRERPMSENAFSYVMKRMGYQGKATPHGFRATASTILNESGFKPDVIERQLAHLERNKVRAAYHRSVYLEDRKKMMNWWSDFLDGIKAGADVVPLNSKSN
jgi:integrase